MTRSVLTPSGMPASGKTSRADRRAADGTSLNFLGFFLGEEEFGADLNLVAQIVKPPPLTWVPRARAHLLGVISIRGKVVTLVDLRQLLGLAPTSWPRTARVLLVDHEGEPIGLLVDGVTHVHRVAIEQFETGVTLEDDTRSEHVLGVARPDDSTRVTVVDLIGILSELLR